MNLLLLSKLSVNRRKDCEASERQPDKENSDFKTAKLHFKIDLVSHPLLGGGVC